MCCSVPAQCWAGLGRGSPESVNDQVLEGQVDISGLLQLHYLLRLCCALPSYSLDQRMRSSIASAATAGHLSSSYSKIAKKDSVRSPEKSDCNL